MGIVSQSSSNLMLSLRVVLISTSVLVTAMILKRSAPLLTEFAFSELPSIWGVVVPWLRPPYLYVVVNCIIITIVATSKLQQKVAGEFPPEAVIFPVPTETVVFQAPIKISEDYGVVYGGVDAKSASVEVRPEISDGYDVNVVKGSDFDVFEQVDAGMPEVEIETTALAVVDPDDVSVQDEVSDATTLPLITPRMSSTEYSLSSNEQPPVSVRTGHRKAGKSSPEGGRSLGVSKPKRHETMESTWKTISEGRAIPLARHHRKSDTWETHGRVGHHLQADDQAMTKSETFNHRPPPRSAENHPPRKLRRDSSGSGKLRKEPSPGLDELNLRVEAFIRKFNEDMRLQRQESLNQYMERIHRGAP
ncbi:Cyclin-L1 like [Actinidia chinensis var. chinensis]|uniref:Cyclin-L1 like n=1 Tax=Actinidia chinensis var. chinensis TaxID=1590841 RepID=A0A2R6QWT8_ACTCC|nr:Cyclin-L1 like [Actinidia chinensis var. chinensis]